MLANGAHLRELSKLCPRYVHDMSKFRARYVPITMQTNETHLRELSECLQ